MSTPVTLHCPHCGTKLKIKNQALFGQSVKCPGCQKKFVLRDPNEPVTPPAESPPPAVSPAPATGKSSASQPPQPRFPDFSSFTGQSTDDVPPFFAPPAASPPAASPPGPIPDFTATANAPGGSTSPAVTTPKSVGAGGAIPLIPDEDDLAPIVKKRAGGRWGNYVTLLVVLLAAVGIGTYLATTPRQSSQPISQNPMAGTAGTSRPLDENQPYSKEILERDGNLIAEFKPTAGEPIQLLMMPSGVSMLIHLRPAQLWSDRYEYKVLQASLTDDVTGWLSDRIQSLSLRTPEQIEELTIGVMLGSRGSMPQYCVVVRLVEPEKLSSMIEGFPGRYLFDITEKPDVRIKVDEERGYLIRDEKTFAICPATMADELEFSLKEPTQDVSVGMMELLQRTDRQRLFTAIAGVSDMEIHLPTLAPASAQPFLQAVCSWLGEDVEMVSWSVHPEPYFHSEIAVRPVTTKEVVAMETELKEKLKLLPERVWKELCSYLHPREIRFQKLIGRLPAMLEAYQQSTVSRREKRCVLLTTVLPAKAAPNLALAALFTLDEAGRTNFSQSAVAANEKKPKLPDTVAGRLKIPVDAEFQNTPLEQALTYLCSEVQVQLEIDGDALKLAGYTKNMGQTFNLGKVPMQRALFQIVNQYQEKDKEMAVSVDEARKTLILHTKKSADEKGMQVYPLAAE